MSTVYHDGCTQAIASRAIEQPEIHKKSHGRADSGITLARGGYAIQLGVGTQKIAKAFF